MMMYLFYNISLFWFFIFKDKFNMINGILGNMIIIISNMLMFNFINYIDWIFISYSFGINFYSYFLLILVFWIMGLIMMFITDKFCLNLILMLMIVLQLNFYSMNFLMFYFFFEISLMIMFIMILKWGMGNMRLLASYYFMFYTLFFSFPLLMFIIMLMLKINLSMMNLMELMNLKLNMYMFIYMLMSFLMKIPMFMFHNWLLKAHVEAPVFGSMILAAILLKLGTYGLLRLILITYLNFLKLNFLILIFSLIGSLYISIICLRQIDMKILVAYSSVVHMGLLLSSMMTLTKLGFIGSYIMMIAHGLCSSGLFFMVNLFYNETNSRLMLINKGMMCYMSSLILFWFLLCSSNMAAPISLNLISELMLLMNLIIWFKYLMIILMLFCFFSFCYSLYLFSYIHHGEINFYISVKSIKLNNYFILLMHWIPLNLLFLNLNMFLI